MHTLSDDLSRRDVRILRYIVSFRQELGISPTYREIQRFLGLSSTEQVLRSVRRLKALGLLSSNPNLGGLSRNLIPTALGIRYIRDIDDSN